MKIITILIIAGGLFVYSTSPVRYKKKLHGANKVSSCNVNALTSLGCAPQLTRIVKL